MLKIKEIFNKYLTKENLNSFFIAILCMSGLISFIIDIDNIIPVIELVIFILMEFINFKETKQSLKKFKLKNYLLYIIIFVFIMLLFGLTIAMHGFRKTTIIRLLYFIGFICIPFACCRHQNNINRIINSILIISGVLAIPLFNINLGHFDGGTRMSISYYMLPTYVSMVMSFFINNKQKNLIKFIIKIIVFSTLFIPYIRFFVEYVSRGVVLAVFVCLFLCFIIKKSIKFKLISIIGTIIIGIIFFEFLLEPTLNYTHKFLEKHDIRIEIISKSYQLLEKDSLDNGRNEVYSKAIEGIKQHPIIGNGIGDYAHRYITYPHNLILQAWYEGGILFFILMMFIVFYSVYIFVFDSDINIKQKYLLMFFFSLSIIRLMLSFEFWKEISFGLYLFMIFNILNKRLQIRRSAKHGLSNNTNI